MLILRNQVPQFRFITIGILQILPADARLRSRHALSVTSAAALWARHIIGIDHGRAHRLLGTDRVPTLYPSLK